MRNKPARFHFFLQRWSWFVQQFGHKNVYPFLFAVMVSAIFHAYLLQSVWHFFNLHQQDKVQNRTINARLLPLKKNEKSENKILEKVPQKIIAKKVKKKLAEPPPAPKVEEVAPPAPSEQPILAENLQPLNETLPADAAENMQNSPTGDGSAVIESSEIQVSETEDSLAEPYQYVESRFDVFMDADGKPSRSPAGTATIIYQTLEQGEKYQLKNSMTANGLAALVIPDLLQTSEGAITPQGLQPAHYLYQFGTRKNKTYRADFDWQTNSITLQNAKGTQTQELLQGTQDLLSFMYQFMFAPPLNQMQLNITNGKKLRQYDYSFEGEEVLETKLGRINTVHLSHDAVEREEKTEIWLATDYRYLPVKIRKIEKQDKVYEMIVNTLQTDLGNLTIQPN